MIPAGAILGFLGGLLIEIIVGLIARAVFSADHPAAFSWHFLGSLPGLGVLLGAIVAPILYTPPAVVRPAEDDRRSQRWLGQPAPGTETVVLST